MLAAAQRATPEAVRAFGETRVRASPRMEREASLRASLVYASLTRSITKAFATRPTLPPSVRLFRARLGERRLYAAKRLPGDRCAAAAGLRRRGARRRFLPHSRARSGPQSPSPRSRPSP